MNERTRAPNTLLQELGWLTIQWARVEAYIDLLTAYLHDRDRGKILPRPFNARLKFLRQELKHPTLINVQLEGIELLDRAMRASRERNELVHGIVVQWSEDGGAVNTVLRSTSHDYIAIQGLAVSEETVKGLTIEMQALSARLFGLLERIKAIFGLLEGQPEFYQVARLEGDRG